MIDTIKFQIPKRYIPALLIPVLLSTIMVAYAQNVVLSDTFHVSDSFKLPTVTALSDAFHASDTFTIGQIINIVTTTLTSIITQIGSTCTTCYSNGDVITAIVIPAILLIVTGFGFMFMGVKAFGVFILVESFTIMMLSYIGIIPSWFILFIILFVSAGLTRIVLSFFRGNG